MTDLKEPVRYICKKFPKFYFRIDTTRYQFVDGQLVVHAQEDVDALDNLLKTNPAFQIKFFKVDKAAAAEFVRQQRNQNKGVMTGAIKGGVDSQDIINSQTAQPLKERDAELAAMGEKQADALRDELAQDSELVLTKKVEQPVISSVTPKEKPANPLAGLVEKK